VRGFPERICSDSWVVPPAQNPLATYMKCSYDVGMKRYRFKWDANKARSNERKHGVSFEEAQTVFFDEEALFMADPDHSADEERFLLLGLSAKLRVLLVCHGVREEEEIRIISARKGAKKERRQYEERVRA
jgi:uncharacterized protein